MCRYAPLFFCLIACSGSNSAVSDDLVTLPEPDAGTLVDPAPSPTSDAGLTPTGDASTADLATVSLSIAKIDRPVTLVDANGFVPQAKTVGESIEVRVWVTPPNTHEGGYSVEEGFTLSIPAKVGTAKCTAASASYVHSRLYDASPEGAPVYNPFESFATKAAASACTITTKTIDAKWVEGTATGTMTRIKNVNGTSAAAVAFTITYRVPRL